VLTNSNTSKASFGTMFPTKAYESPSGYTAPTWRDEPVQVKSRPRNH
jgi:hypothetical protein